MRDVWRVAAEVVAGVHFAFLGYVAGGGFLSWRWPRAIVAHLAALGWGLAGLVMPVACPLTGLQDVLRRWAGEPPLRGGFVDQYVEGVLYPERFTPLVRAVLAAAVVVSWLGFVRRSRAGQASRAGQFGPGGHAGHGVAGGVTGR
jgi:Protein of Unknown function (DUF2784)